MFPEFFRIFRVAYILVLFLFLMLESENHNFEFKIIDIFLISVKFLREVTPYFRKASIISEVGWELQRAFLCPLGPGVSVSPPAPKTTPRADTRYIPLQLTHLARNLKYIDPGEFILYIAL